MDADSKGKWEEDWDKSKGGFPFSEKLGEISDKIGNTIDDTINKFRKKDRDDSPDRIRCVCVPNTKTFWHPYKQITCYTTLVCNALECHIK